LKILFKCSNKLIIKVLDNANNILGIGDWGLGIGTNPQSPIPNPQKIKINNK